jgi:hypothetical protein
MNARNEIRRQTIRVFVGTAETETKYENPNLYFFYNISSIFLTMCILFSYSMLKLMNKKPLYYILNSFVLLRN